MLEGPLDFFRKIYEGIMWRTLLAQFDWVDWFTVGFVILGIAYGSRKGFMREIVEITELLLVIFLAYTYKEIFFSFLKTILPSFTNRILEPVVLSVSLTLFWFLVAFLDGHLQKVIHAKTLPGLKVTGGAFLGILHFLLIWSLISQILIVMPYLKFSKMYEKGNSVSGQSIKEFIPFIYDVLTQPATHFSGLKA